MNKKLNKKQMPNELFVYNLAIKREDGRVEQDTVYREKLFTKDDVERLGIKFSCSVLVSCVGTYHVAASEFIKENTFVYDLPKAKEVSVDGQSVEQDNAESK